MFNRSLERDTNMKTWIRRTLVASSAALLVGTLAACSSGFADASSGSGPSGNGPHGMLAQQGGPHGEGHMAKRQARMLERVASKLDLDDTQKQKLAALATQVQAQGEAMRGGMKPARDEMLSLLSGDTFDQARAQALVLEKTQQVQARAPQLIAAMADFYDSLRPEQQAQVREFAQKRSERMGSGEGHRHHGS